MTAVTAKDIVMLTTPRGHEVRAVLDYTNFELSHAKVVNHYTGIVKSLDNATAETLKRALKARQVYEHALSETKALESTLRSFGEVAVSLGNKHPALEPYWREAEQHKSIAADMRTQARHFHDDAMEAIDKLIDN